MIKPYLNGLELTWIVLLHKKGKLLNLTQSYRIPRAVHDVAMGIVRRISKRRYKEWAPRTRKGSLTYYHEMKDERLNMGSGDWMVFSENKTHVK